MVVNTLGEPQPSMRYALRHFKLETLSTIVGGRATRWMHMAVNTLGKPKPSTRYALRHFKLINGDVRGLLYCSWKMLGVPSRPLQYQVRNAP